MTFLKPFEHATETAFGLTGVVNKASEADTRANRPIQGTPFWERPSGGPPAASPKAASLESTYWHECPPKSTSFRPQSPWLRSRQSKRGPWVVSRHAGQAPYGRPGWVSRTSRAA